MDELKTSLVVSGRGKLMKATFDKPVSVQGKSIGVKSVSFPKTEDTSHHVRYKVRVRDSTGVIHTLSLPPSEWQFSDNILRAIFDVLLELYESLETPDREIYIIEEETSPIRDSRKPWYSGLSNFGLISRQKSTIHYGTSGLRILTTSPGRVSWFAVDDVFELLRGERLIENNDQELSYFMHAVKLPEPDPDTIALQPLTETVFLYCDAIKPTYVRRVKERILDSINRTYSGSYFSNSCIQYHEFAVDELMHISFYFQTVDGIVLNFDDPVVIHFSIQ